MKFKPDNRLPIHIQLVDYLRYLIFSDYFKPGSQIPSVRELSQTLEVNPNTLLKALSEIEEQGLINTKRTLGKFITTDLSLIKNAKDKYIKKRIKVFLNDMSLINLTLDELIERIKDHDK